MIDKPTIRKIVKSEMSSFLFPLNYKMLAAKGEMVAEFVMDDGKYFYNFYCFTEKYNAYKLIYGFSFGIESVVKILKQIDAHVPLSRTKYEIKPSITGISPGRLFDPYDPGGGYNYFDTENGLLSVIEEIKSFYKEAFVPFCAKYSSLEELDKLMNTADDFWIDSTGKIIPISFFHVTRLVIARLTNNSDYDMVVNKNFDALEELWKRDGGVYDRFDEKKPEVFAAKYLKQLSFE